MEALQALCSPWMGAPRRHAVALATWAWADSMSEDGVNYSQYYHTAYKS